MKKIRKILFTIIVICTSLFFTSKVMAECNYIFDTTTSIVEDKTNVYLKYLEYVYKKKLNRSTLEFNNLISSFANGKSNNALITTYLSTDANFNLIDYSHKADNYDFYRKQVFTYAELDSDANYIFCPTIIAVESPYINFQQYWSHIKLYHGYNGKKYEIDSSLINSLTDDFFEEKSPTLLVLDSHDLNLTMAQVYVYIGYYGFNFDDEYNIDSIVNKYLYIDGMKDILNSINENLDESSGVNIVEIEEMNEELADEIIDKIADEVIDKIGFETIESDLAELNKFNDNYLLFYNNDDYTGVRRVLKDFLNGSGSELTVTQWFNKYMPDSNAQYVEALEMLLTMLNSDEMRAEKENLNYLEELYKDFNYCLRYHYTIENCKSECEKYYRWDACIYSSNISQCVNSYPSNVCDEKTNQDVVNDVAASEDKIKDHMKDIIDKKFIEYYENYGIQIGDDKELCNILLGKDNENGLYVYIKGVLNAIRIGGPILMVVLTAFDAMKSISSFKDDENKKFWNHLKIRLICVAILILVPTIINFLVKLAISECVVEV